MNFIRERPNKPGYYWYVDKMYPEPNIGFIGPFQKFYDMRWREYNIDSLYCNDNIRFGDLIVKPEPINNKVES